ERGRPFDLSRPPLTRFALARLAPDHHRLVITFHHITLDGWSTSLFLDELFLIHAAGGDATHLTPTAPYRDYLSWLVGQDQGAAEEAWRREFTGCGRRPSSRRPARSTLKRGRSSSS